MTDGQQGTEHGQDMKKEKFNSFIPDKFREYNSFTWNFEAETFAVNKEINLEMLRSGNVWFYEYHAKKEKEYRRAYEEARKEKKGIWKDINPENPRDFRLRNKRR